MNRVLTLVAGVALLASSFCASANEYDDTAKLFKGAGETAGFFHASYGYAVFPTIGKGGFIVGAAHGSGRVYERGKYVGDAQVTQLTVGLQAGGQAFSQIKGGAMYEASLGGEKVSYQRKGHSDDP